MASPPSPQAPPEPGVCGKCGLPCGSFCLNCRIYRLCACCGLRPPVDRVDLPAESAYCLDCMCLEVRCPECGLALTIEQAVCDRCRSGIFCNKCGVVREDPLEPHNLCDDCQLARLRERHAEAYVQ